MSVDLGGIIDSGTSIAGLISGAIIQDNTQAELKKLLEERPTYEIPTSIQEQLNLLRARAQTGLPGESIISGQIQQGTAQGVAASREAATSAADLLGATTNLYGQQTSALTNLSIESARQKAQNELAYAQGLGTMGEYQDKAWNWNKATDWQVEMNRLMGISQSAYDLMMGGLGGVSTAGQSMFGGQTIGGGSSNNNYSGYSSMQGYGVKGIDPAMNNLNLQSGYGNQTMGQNQYNPSGGQTLGQYQYNPNGNVTLGQSMYGGGSWGQ